MDFATTPAQDGLSRAVYEFARRELNDGLADRERQGLFPRDRWRRCAEMGLLGLPVPAEMGGSGQDLVTTTLAMEALGRGCRDNGLVFSLNAQMWACELPLVRFGSVEQKAAWLPKLVGGQIIGAHAATEPDAGSDIFAMRTRAVPVEGGYRLSGNKTFCTNAPIADLLVTFAQVERDGRRPVLTAFLVEAKSTGVTVGRPFDKLGLRTSPTSEVAFDDCFVPSTMRLGAEGQGQAIFLAAMEWERPCLFAAHLGAMERLLEDEVTYARERRQFGQPIGKFEAVYRRAADLKVAIDAGRLLLLRAAWLKDQGQATALEAAEAKLFVSEAHARAGTDALQVFGGYGYLRDFPVEQELRDALAGTIYSGSSEMQRRIIAACIGL